MSTRGKDGEEEDSFYESLLEALGITPRVRLHHTIHKKASKLLKISKISTLLNYKHYMTLYIDFRDFLYQPRF